jgi:hypothetical protein
MEYHKKSNGLITFLEHWGMLLTGLMLVVTVETSIFLINLKGAEWITFLTVAFASLLTGAALILYAKIPLYRSGRFFSFGAKSIPASRVALYRWGWRVLLGGGLLALLLLLSRP